MKKLVLLALILFAFSFSNAQEKTSSNSTDVTFGTKAGLNLAKLTGDIDNADMKIGFHVGGLVEIKLNGRFSVQPEVLFSKQGANYEDQIAYLDGYGNIATGTIEGRDILSYINIPVMVKYYATEGLSLEAGPQIGFLVKAEGEIDGESFNIEETNAIDFGLNFGLGYKLNSGLNFSARYNAGLTNIDDSDFDIEAKNSVFQFSVGYFFN